ncbi:MAG: single-stranded-DNA-specific exonuclease RecJ [Anaerolineae bacterium]|nr:single-stranded-DNA-specific exonuclease RecJ [Anaerolineae bacterium]
MSNHLEKRWEIAPPPPEDIDSALGEFHPVLRRLLYNRGLRDVEEAYNYLELEGSLYDPFLLTDMDKAVARLLQAVQNEEPIAVYGDYDVDGVTASVVLVQALRQLGAQVSPYIPDRFEEGYGLNCQAVKKLAQAGVKLVISVDCGIRSPSEVRLAKEEGMGFIIADHHEPGNILPDADAVVCQKRSDDPYPDKNLAAVGLAYKLVEALYSKIEKDRQELNKWLDLVAIGTVADVVPLQGENRALVRAGLEHLRQGGRQGLFSLAGAASLNLACANAYSIGFILAPRLNAAGRLESALDAFNLLMCTETETAGQLAQKLDNLNRERQEKTRQMYLEAEMLTKEAEGEHILFVCKSKEDFNEGVVGLVAARLVENYYRPSIVAVMDSEKGITRASCRSIPEFHITRALDQCAPLLERYGGHAMAAGFNARNDRLDELQRQLKTIASNELDGRVLRPTLRADMEIPLCELRPELLDYIGMIEPSGHKNPEVSFVSRNLKVRSKRSVGKQGEHLRLTVSDDKITYDGIAFGFGNWAEKMPEYVDLLYAFETNTYQGNTSLQLKVKDIKPSR